MSKILNYKKKEVWLRSCGCAIGYLCFGYNNGIFTSSQACISSYLSWGEKKTFYVALMSSLIPLGGLVGSLAMGYLSNFYGKRKNLMITDLVAVFGALVIIIPSTLSFGIGRFVSGFTMGSFSMLCPQYINEFTPSPIRGAMGSINQLFSLIGLLVSYSVCLLLPLGSCDYNSYYPILIFLGPGFLAFFQFFILLKVFTQESPYWLLKEGRYELAFQSLGSIYKQEYARTEIDNLLTADDQELYDYSIRELLKCKRGTTKAMRIGLLMHIFQQLSGINAILFYSTTIFENYGQGAFFSRILTLTTCIMRIFAAFLLFPVIDKSGRKSITVVCESLMGLSFGLMYYLSGRQGFEIYVIVLIDFYLILFAISIGPICWIYTSEILSDKGMGLCTGVNWSLAFVIVLLFPFVVDLYGLDSTFLAFGLVNFFCSAYLFFDMVETKGLNRLTIRKMFSRMK